MTAQADFCPMHSLMPSSFGFIRTFPLNEVVLIVCWICCVWRLFLNTLEDGDNALLLKRSCVLPRLQTIMYCGAQIWSCPYALELDLKVGQRRYPLNERLGIILRFSAIPKYRVAHPVTSW